MVLLATILVVCLAGLAGGCLLSVSQLSSMLQPVSVIISIIVAAILVRLNRGMPSLEWKAILPTDRFRLSTAILDLTREYVGMIAANSVLLISIVILTAVGKDALGTWPLWITRSISAFIAGLSTLAVSRITYVVWRDYDIVKLQKELIDAAAKREVNGAEAEIAERKIQEMRATSLSR